MKTSGRKTLALVLALVMLLSCCPGLTIAGFATGDDAGTELEGQTILYENETEQDIAEPAPLLDVPFAEEGLPTESYSEISQEELLIEESAKQAVSISAGKLAVTSGNTRISAAEIEAALGTELPVLNANEAAAAKDAASRAVIEERFGLSSEQIGAAKEIYDSMDKFHAQLDILAFSEKSVDLTAKERADIIDLIVHGYTTSQAFAAEIAAPILGVSVAELSEIKAAEVKDADEELDEEAMHVIPHQKHKEEADDDGRSEEYYRLAIRMGVPYSVIEDYMEQSTLSTSEIQERFEAAYDNAYGITREEQQTRSGSAFSFAPEEIMGEAFTYEHLNNNLVNLNKGSTSYEVTDLSIPGINGLDLKVTRRYQSDYAYLAYPTSYVDGNYIETKCLGAGYKAYKLVGTNGNGDLILSELPGDMTDYTFSWAIEQDPDFAGMSPADFGPYYIKKYYPSEYADAAALIESLPKIIITGARYLNQSYNTTIVFKPFIVGVEPQFSQQCKNEAAPYNHYISEFGLGQGWSLGFSAIENYIGGIEQEVKQRLITSDGQKYEIDFQYGPSHLKGYDLEDLILLNSGSGYTGARYTLQHKDGTKEYFNVKGRLIAIVDRFNNAITLSYDLENSGAVSAIHIVDTLGNQITFANQHITYNPNNLPTFNGQSNGKYNAKWTLSIGNDVIRTYYVLDKNLTTGYDGLTLVGVGDEYGHFERYLYTRNLLKFNGFVPTASSNDDIRATYDLSTVIHTNGLYEALEIDGSAPVGRARCGLTGYEEYSKIWRYERYYRDEDNFDIPLIRKDYTFGDFSSVDTPITTDMEGTVGSYSTEVVEKRAWDTPNSTYILDHLHRVYKFERERSTMESETIYTWPAIQEIDIPDDGSISFRVLKENLGVTYAEALEEKTTYVYNVKRLPISISVAHYNRGASTPGMTETRTYTYDNKANVLTEKLPNNQVITYTYHNTYSLPLKQTYKQDASTTIVKQNTLSNSNKTIGQTTTTVNGVLSGKSVYTYDSSGRLTTEKKYRDATNYTETQYVYNSSAKPTAVVVKGVKDADGALVTGSTGYAAGQIATQSTYNNRGWVASQTDAEGNTTSFQYDLKGRIARVTNPDASYATYTYDDVNRTATYTNELGMVMRYEYDYLGNRTGVYDVTGSQYISNSRYNGFGWQFATFQHRTDGGAVKTYLHHDALGRVTQEGNINASGSKVSHVTYEYSYTGNQLVTTKTVLGATGAPSIITKSYVDKMGYQVKTGRKLGTTEYVDTYTCDYLGNVVTEKDAYTASLGRSFSHKYTYDYAGRVLTDTDTLNRVISATYDWLGNKLTSTDPSGTVTLYDYDALGRLLRTRQPVSTSGSTTYYATTVNAYDRNGNIVLTKVANNAPGAAASWTQTGYTYDNRGRVVKVTEDVTGSPTYVQYYYDALGNVLRMYTGLHATLTISGLDQVSGTDTDYAVTKYAYDRFSNCISTIDPLNQTETSTYDLNGSVLTKTDRKGVTTTYTYDDHGRVTGITAGGTSLTYTYTLTGAPKSLSNGTTTTTYTYDALGRVLTETDGSNVRTYAYNIGNARTSFVLNTGGITRLNNVYTYDELNRLKTVTYDTTTYVTYAYDTNGNRSSVTYNNGNTETYTYNLANMLTSLVNKKGATVLSQYTYTYLLDGNWLTETDKNGKVKTYTYDGHNRLTREQEQSGGTVSQTYAYTYDDYGNRATLTATGTDAFTAAYAYDRNNRLLTESKTTGGSTTTTTYTYDNNGNELTKKIAGATVEQRVYNGLNQLTGVTAGGVATTYGYTPAGLRNRKTVGSTVTTYVLDGKDVVMETTGSAVRRYIRGFDLAVALVGTTPTYFLYDGHGSVVQLTNSSGNSTKTYEYDAFGNEKSPVGTDTNYFRYCGEYYDKETGDYYLRARYYDPTLGRFSQEDSFRDGLNWYVYCGNNPVRFIDPSGQYYIQENYTYGKFSQGVFDRAAFWIGKQTCFDDNAYNAEDELIYCATVDLIIDAVGSGRFSSPTAVTDEYINENIDRAINERKQSWNTLVTATVAVSLQAAKQGGQDYLRQHSLGNNLVFGSEAKSATKLDSQMNQRGWTKETIRATVDSPYTIRESINKATGNVATAYYNQRGAYVVVDNVTREVVQISDFNHPETWVPDSGIINPYFPNR